MLADFFGFIRTAATCETLFWHTLPEPVFYYLEGRRGDVQIGVEVQERDIFEVQRCGLHSDGDGLKGQRSDMRSAMEVCDGFEEQRGDKQSDMDVQVRDVLEGQRGDLQSGVEVQERDVFEVHRGDLHSDCDGLEGQRGGMQSGMEVRDGFEGQRGDMQSDTPLPAWVKEGNIARWWSVNGNRFCDVTISKVDDEAKEVTVVFEVDASCWKRVSFDHFSHPSEEWLLCRALLLTPIWA